MQITMKIPQFQTKQGDNGNTETESHWPRKITGITKTPNRQEMHTKNGNYSSEDIESP